MKSPEEAAVEFEYTAESLESSKEMSKESTIFKHTEAEVEDPNDIYFDQFLEDRSNLNSE